MRHFSSGLVLLSCAALALAPSSFAQCAVDQQQTSFTSSAGGDRWQSFTAGVTGELCQIDVNCQNASSGNDLEVHFGEGAGALLHREEGVALIAGITSLVLCAPVPVVLGRTYSFRLTATNAWRLQIPGNYGGGRASCCPSDDHWFRTWVRPTAPIPVVCTQDQGQTSANSSAGGDRWQSFTAGATGYLCQVDVTCQNASASALEIWRGEGTAGARLHRQEIVSLGAGLTSIPIDARVLVSSGQVYTVRLTAANAWSLQIPGAYSGGRASTGAGDDFWFRTWVQAWFRDQEAVTFNSSAGGDRWQSFTAGLTGDLVQVEVNCQNASAGNTLLVYQGEGVAGTLLQQQNNVALAAGVTTVAIAARVPVTAGSVYTLRFTATNAWRLQIPGTYAGGRASTGASDDYWFRTWVRPTCLVAGPGHYCGGSFPLVCASDTVIGTTFQVRFQNPQLLGFLLLGFPPISVPPIPLGPPLACARELLYAPPTLVLATQTDPGSVSLPLPNDASIVGVGLVLQATAVQSGNCLRLTDAAVATLRRP